MSSTDNNEESDLYIFKGMEGFEEFNPSDDSTLIALLDDLQEDTLMTLFSDDLLMGVSEDPFKEGSYSAGQSLQSESPFNIDNDVLYRDIKYCQESNSLEDFSDQRKLKRSKQLRQEGEIGPLKRPRLNSISEKYILDHEHTLTCVRHDHSYALPPEDDQSSHLNSPNSDEEVSNEESNNSDAGYDTMSTSTSPGRSNSGDRQLVSSIKGSSSAPHSTSHPPACLPLETTVDPVALIDARIKHYMCSREVNLTEEEKETLKAEGLPIPTTLPLTKVEEKALKTVRRKLRNKVAAQESRKRKKELMQTLEERVSEYSRENVHLKKRVEALEMENKSLVEHLRKLQTMLIEKPKNSHGSAKVGTCIMVIILCFAVLYGGSSPSLWSNQKQTYYNTASVRSRSLLSVDPNLNFPGRACDWFRQIFREQVDDYPTSNNYVVGQPLVSGSSHMTVLRTIMTVNISNTQYSQNMTEF